MRYVNSEKDEKRAERRMAGRSEQALLTAGMIRSIIIALFILVYAYLKRDVPAFFLCVSFLAFMLRPFAEKLGGFGKSLSLAMKGFAVALAVGAMVMAFF